MGEQESLTPEVQAFLVKQMHRQLIDPDNPNSLMQQVAVIGKKVEKIEEKHRVVLMLAMSIGVVINFFKDPLLSFFKHLNGGN